MKLVCWASWGMRERERNNREPSSSCKKGGRGADGAGHVGSRGRAGCTVLGSILRVLIRVLVLAGLEPVLQVLEMCFADWP